MMIDKTLRDAAAKRCGDVITIHMMDGDARKEGKLSDFRQSF